MDRTGALLELRSFLDENDAPAETKEAWRFLRDETTKMVGVILSLQQALVKED